MEENSREGKIEHSCIRSDTSKSLLRKLNETKSRVQSIYISLPHTKYHI